MSADLVEISEVEIISATHSSVTLDWSSALLQFKYRVLNDTDRIYTMLQLNENNNEAENEWNKVYIGYGDCKVVENLRPKKQYLFRVRFHRTDDNYSAWSPIVKVFTTHEPYYGENFHKAVQGGNLTEIQNILYTGNITVDVPDSQGLNALMNTAKLGQTKIMELLLSFKASVSSKDDSGKTALMHACFHGQLPAAKLLFENGAVFKDFDLGGSSAIHYAIDSCNNELIEWIFSVGADVNCRDTNVGWTPLMRCASLTGNPAVAMGLIRNRANINLKDNDGKTCLMIAVINGHQELVEILLENNVDTTAVNKSGSTAYQMAVSLDKKAIQHILKPVE